MANYHPLSKMGILVKKYKKKYPKAMAEVKALNELQRKPKYSWKNVQKKIKKFQKWNEKRELKAIEGKKRRLNLEKQKAAIAIEEAKIYNAKLKAAKAKKAYQKETDMFGGMGNFGGFGNIERPSKKKKNQDFDFFNF